jgi:hypothetical protein
MVATAWVAVPDHGWADGTRFGNVVVLADGRILAIGNRVWLVAPDGPVQDLGRAGGYPDHPLVTARDGALRLYSHGAGPWWIELPHKE